jgi:hypothetical protein
MKSAPGVVLLVRLTRGRTGRKTSEGRSEEPPNPFRILGARSKRTARERLSLGLKGLDDMCGGGIPAGYSV